MNYIKWVVFGLLALAAVSLIGIAAKVVLFPAMVAGTVINSAEGVVKKTLNADNVIHNYEWFYDTNAAIESRLGQIKSHSSLVKTADAGERSTLNMEMSAMMQTCRDLTTKYNANSEKVNRSLFKSNGLPESFPVSICESK